LEILTNVRAELGALPDEVHIYGSKGPKGVVRLFLVKTTDHPGFPACNKTGYICGSP
jgi:hypothetical protein